MTTGLGADHHAIITYLKETLPLADRTGKLVDVADPGYYYYDNTTGVQKWKTFGGGAEQDFKALPTSSPFAYNYITKGAGIGSNGTSLGTGGNNIGIGNAAFNFLNNSDMTGHNNIALGIATFNFRSGGTLSSTNNIGIGLGIYSIVNNGSMSGGSNIGMGMGVFGLQKTNAQFSGFQNTGIGNTIFDLQNGDLAGNNNIGIGKVLFRLQNGDLIGSDNIAMGNSLYYLPFGNMGGSSNIGIGGNSYYVQNGNIALTASKNIALGSSIYRLSNSSTSTFSGQNNIGIGNALYNLSLGNLTGQRNIGMGNNVFRLSSGNFSGNDNIGIGSSAMQVSGDIAGNYNIGIGTSAMQVSGGIAGNYNIGIGNLAMNALGGIAGNHNIALGYQTMYTAKKVAGTDNIAIGNSVLYPTTNTDIGSYNIGIGNWALYADMAKGNANIQLGNWYVGTPVAGQLNNVVAIGNEMNGLTTSNTDSNTILLGKPGSGGPKVGVGTFKPGAKLEINNGTTAGAVKIVDGTQGAGKVLTSDANGLATWKRQALTLIEGVKGSGISIPPSTTGYIYTGSYITLPPGKYMVSVQNLITVGFPNYSNGHFWLRTTFSDSNTTFVRTADIDSTKGFLISGLLPQGARFSMLNGSLIIENTTSSPKTYYYWAGDVEATPGTTIPLENFGGWAEWSMTATPIQ